jgi:hypothetical protein
MESTMGYMYEAHLVFTHVADGVYQVIKDKRDAFNLGCYVASPSVAQALNKEYIKVAIYDHRKVFIHANFELIEEDY